MDPMTGGCQCGAVRYQIRGTPIETYVCHCRECRAQSASAFGISVIVRAADLRVLHGATTTWSRPTDTGRTVDCAFCVRCGSRLFHATPGEDTVSVKGGSLDQPPDLSTVPHIWTARRLAGVIISDTARQFPAEPD